MPTKTLSRFAEIDAELDKPRVQCVLCRWLSEADRADAEFIDTLVRNSGKTASHIARVLTAGGVKIGESTVKRHRSLHLDQ